MFDVDDLNLTVRVDVSERQELSIRREGGEAVNPAQVEPSPVYGSERLRIDANERGFVIVLLVEERQLSVPRPRSTLVGFRVVFAP